MVFRSKKKLGSTTPTYVSNVKLHQLGFMEQLDREVAVISLDGKIAIDRAVHVCVTEEALKQTILERCNKENKDYRYMEMSLGLALDNVIQQEWYDAMLLYGLSPMTITITKKDLLPIRDLVDSYCIMNAEVGKRIDHKKAYELMREKIVYIVGTLPNVEIKTEDNFGYEVIKRKSETGKEYEAVKCFLTIESAQKCNGNKRAITPVLVGSLVHFVGAIIIEPHRNYWVEFRWDEVKEI